jgi:hypothetical protein
LRGGLPGATRHWSLADPSAVEGDEEVGLRAFRATADALTARIRSLLGEIEAIGS